MIQRKARKHVLIANDKQQVPRSLFNSFQKQKPQSNIKGSVPLNISRIQNQTNRTQYPQQQSILNDFDVLLNNPKRSQFNQQHQKHQKKREFANKLQSSDKFQQSANKINDYNYNDIQGQFDKFHLEYQSVIQILITSHINTYSLRKAHQILINLCQQILSFKSQQILKQIQYQIVQNIVMNFWKINSDVYSIKSDKSEYEAEIVRKKSVVYNSGPKITTIRFLTQYIPVLEQLAQKQNITNNKITILCLVLAKQYFKQQNMTEALQSCSKGFKYCPRYKNTSLLLKLHYLKSKIYQNIQAIQPQNEQIKKCIFFLKNISQTASQNKQFSHEFLKSLLKRREQLRNIIQKSPLTSQIHPKSIDKYSSQHKRQQSQYKSKQSKYKRQQSENKQASVNKFRRRSISFTKLKSLHQEMNKTNQNQINKFNLTKKSLEKNDFNAKSNMNLKSNIALNNNKIPLLNSQAKKQFLKLDINRKTKLKKKGHTLWQKNIQKLGLQQKISKQLQTVISTPKTNNFVGSQFSDLILQRPNTKPKTNQKPINQQGINININIKQKQRQQFVNGLQKRRQKKKNTYLSIGEKQQKQEGLHKKKQSQVQSSQSGNKSSIPIQSQLINLVSTMQKQLLQKFIARSDIYQRRDSLQLQQKEISQNETLSNQHYIQPCQLLTNQQKLKTNQQKSKTNEQKLKANEQKLKANEHKLKTKKVSQNQLQQESKFNQIIEEYQNSDDDRMSSNQECQSISQQQDTTLKIFFRNLITNDPNRQMGILTGLGVLNDITVQVTKDKVTKHHNRFYSNTHINKQNKSNTNISQKTIRQSKINFNYIDKDQITQNYQYILVVAIKLNNEHYKLQMIFEDLQQTKQKSYKKINKSTNNQNQQSKGQQLQRAFISWILQSTRPKQQQKSLKFLNNLHSKSLKEILSKKKSQVEQLILTKIIQNIHIERNPCLGYPIIVQKTNKHKQLINHKKIQNQLIFEMRQKNFQYQVQYFTNQSHYNQDLFYQNKHSIHFAQDHVDFDDLSYFFIQLNKQFNIMQNKQSNKSQNKQINKSQNKQINKSQNKQTNKPQNKHKYNKQALFFINHYNFVKQNDPQQSFCQEMINQAFEKQTYDNKNYFKSYCLNKRQNKKQKDEFKFIRSSEVSSLQQSSDQEQQSNIYFTKNQTNYELLANFSNNKQNQRKNQYYKSNKSLINSQNSSKQHGSLDNYHAKLLQQKTQNIRQQSNIKEQNHLSKVENHVSKASKIMKTKICSSVFPKLKYAQILRQRNKQQYINQSSGYMQTTINQYNNYMQTFNQSTNYIQRNINQSTNYIQRNRDKYLQTQSTLIRNMILNHYIVKVIDSANNQHPLKKKISARKSQLPNIQQNFFNQKDYITMTNRSNLSSNVQNNNLRKTLQIPSFAGNSQRFLGLPQVSSASKSLWSASGGSKSFVQFGPVQFNQSAQHSLVKQLKKALIQPQYEKSSILLTYYQSISISSFYNIMSVRPSYIKLTCFRMKQIYLQKQEDLNLFYLFQLQQRQARTRMHKFIIDHHQVTAIMQNISTNTTEIYSQNKQNNQQDVSEVLNTSKDKENKFNFVRDSGQHTKTLPQNRSNKSRHRQNNQRQGQLGISATSSKLPTIKSSFRKQFNRNVQLAHLKKNMKPNHTLQESLVIESKSSYKRLAFNYQSLTVVLKCITPQLIIRKDYLYTTIGLKYMNHIFYLANKFTRIDQQLANININSNRIMQTHTQVSLLQNINANTTIDHKSKHNIHINNNQNNTKYNLNNTKSNLNNTKHNLNSSKHNLTNTNIDDIKAQKYRNQFLTKQIKAKKILCQKSILLQVSRQALGHKGYISNDKQISKSTNQKINKSAAQHLKKSNAQQIKQQNTKRMSKTNENDTNIKIKKYFSIITIMKIQKSKFFTIKLYISQFQRSYSLTLDKSILKSFTLNDFKKIFDNLQQTKQLILDLQAVWDTNYNIDNNKNHKQSLQKHKDNKGSQQKHKDNKESQNKHKDNKESQNKHKNNKDCLQEDKNKKHYINKNKDNNRNDQKKRNKSYGVNKKINRMVSIQQGTKVFDHNGIQRLNQNSQTQNDQQNQLQNKQQTQLQINQQTKNQNNQYKKIQINQQTKIQNNQYTKIYLMNQIQQLMFQGNQLLQKKIWNNVLSLIEIEQKFTQDKIYLIMKLSNYHGFIKDSSLLEYFEMNSQLFMIEMTINKRNQTYFLTHKQLRQNHVQGITVKRGVVKPEKFKPIKQNIQSNKQKLKDNQLNKKLKNNQLSKKSPYYDNDHRNIIDPLVINSRNQQFQKISSIYQSKSEQFTLYVQIFKIYSENQHKKNIFNNIKFNSKQNLIQKPEQTSHQKNNQVNNGNDAKKQLNFNEIPSFQPSNNISLSKNESETSQLISLKSNQQVVDRFPSRKNTVKSTSKSINLIKNQQQKTINMQPKNQDRINFKKYQQLKRKQRELLCHKIKLQKILSGKSKSKQKSSEFSQILNYQTNKSHSQTNKLSSQTNNLHSQTNNYYKENDYEHQQIIEKEIQKINFSFYLSQLNDLFKCINQNYSQQFNQQFFTLSQLQTAFKILKSVVIQQFFSVGKHQSSQVNSSLKLCKTNKIKKLFDKLEDQKMFKKSILTKLKSFRFQQNTHFRKNGDQLVNYKSNQYNINITNSIQTAIPVENTQCQQKFISLHSKTSNPWLIDVHILSSNIFTPTNISLQPKLCSLLYKYNSLLFLMTNSHNFSIKSVTIPLGNQNMISNSPSFNLILLLKDTNQLTVIRDRLFRYYKNLLLMVNFRQQSNKLK